MEGSRWQWRWGMLDNSGKWGLSGNNDGEWCRPITTVVKGVKRMTVMAIMVLSNNNNDV
ncbi:hypothetical protein SESBI_19887 [Sesbania bispinosa]|nr:hypothetical protein SESBI_19887 [Sesbania bispinosa]